MGMRRSHICRWLKQLDIRRLSIRTCTITCKMGTEVLELATLPSTGAVHKRENADRNEEATEVQEVQRDSSGASRDSQQDPLIPSVDRVSVGPKKICYRSPATGSASLVILYLLYNMRNAYLGLERYIWNFPRFARNNSSQWSTHAVV